MTLQEEISRMENKLQFTSALKERAEAINDILNKYAVFQSKDGKPYVQRLMLLATELNSDEYRAWGYYHSGNINRLSGNYTTALVETDKALKLFKSLDHRAGIAHSYTSTGHIHYRLGNYEGALSNHRTSLEIREAINDRKGIAMAFNNIGTVHWSKGDYEKALSSFLASLKVFEAIGDSADKIRLASLYTNIGCAYEFRHNYTEALSNHLASLKITEEIGDQYGIASSYNNIGSVYYHQGDYSKALSSHLASLRIMESIGDNLSIARSYLNIGNVYWSQGNDEEALTNYLAALRIKEDIGDKSGVIHASNNIGNVYYKQGDYKKALSYYLRARKISEEIGSKRGIAAACDNIGNVYAMLNDHQQALANYIPSLKINIEVGDRAGISESNIHIGSVQTALKQYEEASSHLEEGLKIADEIGSKEKKTEALKAWYELKKAQGEGMAALAYHEQYITSKEDLNNEETAKKIAGLKFSYEIDKKEKQLEIEQLINVELKRERDRAEQSEKFKEQFLANMSHELRTPMNAVLGMTNLLLDSPLNDKQKKYLTAVRKSSENLLVILNDILDLSKLEAGKMELERSPFRLRDQVDNVIDILRFKAEEKGIDLTAEIGAEVPDVVIGDAGRLNQVLLNLTSNAIKFTPKGFVKLSLSGTSEILFRIEDSGIGMTPEQQTKIFESFVQAESNTGRKYGGTGLGLAISKTLVELHGGTIGVNSEAGKGSTFFFSIAYPVGTVNDLSISERQPDNDYSALASLRVLIAEDNEFNQIVIKDTLENILPGISIEIVPNGKEAIDKLSSSPSGTYDLILMDLHMPVMDGYEATRYIRGELKSKIPVIALTASVIKSDLDKCTDAGMNGFVPKPFKRDELLRELQRALGAGV